MPQEPPATADGGPTQETSGHAQSSKLIHARYLAAAGAPLHIRRAAGREDFNTIKQMIDDAKDRLRERGTDQWSTDWPDQFGRRRIHRVMASIKEGKTWLAEFRSRDVTDPGMIAAATVTVEETGSTTVWTEAELSAYRAVYLNRLVVAEGLSGFHIGAAIIDWAGRRAWKRYNAHKIRIDVWTANTALHSYYEKRGFEESGLVADKNYPAQQRYERDTSDESGLGPSVLDSETPSGHQNVHNIYELLLTQLQLWPLLILMRNKKN